MLTNAQCSYYMQFLLTIWVSDQSIISDQIIIFRSKNNILIKVYVFGVSKIWPLRSKDDNFYTKELISVIVESVISLTLILGEEGSSW